MLTVLSGLFMGCLHVISGPDHIAAISPLAIGEKKSSWIIGLKWGIGHTSGVFVVGLLALLFREIISVEIVSSFGEKIVGVVLIGIGVWSLQRIVKSNLHIHSHEHNGTAHLHFHSHEGHAFPVSIKISPENSNEHFPAQTALVVGVIHGLAGSSHLLGVLPALALPTKVDAFYYLISFGAGTVLTMAIFSEMLGRIAHSFAEYEQKIYRSLSISFSSIAIAIGLFWIIK